MWVNELLKYTVAATSSLCYHASGHTSSLAALDEKRKAQNHWCTAEASSGC